MGYRSMDEFKGLVVDRMRQEVDPDKDRDSLIGVRSTPPERKESGEADTENTNRPRRRRLWSGGIPSKADTEPTSAKHTNATERIRQPRLRFLRVRYRHRRKVHCGPGYPTV